MIDMIAFDADDTLWHTETYYREVEHSFLNMLAGYGLETAAVLDVFHRIEIDNLAYFGYGIRGFTLSMIETAIQVTEGKVQGRDIEAILEMGKGMTGHEIRLLDGVEEALTALVDRRLMLITKGDALDQESKIRRSGLMQYFPIVEILTDKTREAYTALLQKYEINAGNFLMIGNSLRSDIAPVLELGGYAVHVPYPMSWAHESVAELPADRSRFFEIATLHELPGLLHKIQA
jgi:putative hydrolase of the HAD superfamily